MDNKIDKSEGRGCISCEVVKGKTCTGYMHRPVSDPFVSIRCYNEAYSSFIKDVLKKTSVQIKIKDTLASSMERVCDKMWNTLREMRTVHLSRLILAGILVPTEIEYEV